ncbi:glycosyltransferase [Streptomyces sp. CAU 1734]|uniref:glycosyltransferase n=1 Tax=Streptomyces sp. CAU 1734 TaxID=3140360 RepID=UPI003261ADFE
MVRLYAHDHRTASARGSADGPALMHREAAGLLAASGLPVVWHDLAMGPSGVAGAGPGDTVYAGAGPYAYLHHLWRRRAGAGYRIVREVNTALWSGHWAQEELCGPLVQPGDLVLFPTEYARRLYMRHFPASVTEETSAVARPMLDLLPARRPARRVPPPDRPLCIGYLGALHEAENFDQVLSVFARCHRESGGRTTLRYAGGGPGGPRWEPGRIAAEAAGAGVDPAAVRPAGVLGRDRLTEFFAEIDVLLFPSTSSRESLGRAVVEALAHGVPVLAADIGPAAELLPARNLVPAALDTAGRFTMDRAVPMARVDELALTAKLLARDFDPAVLAEPERYTTGTFLRTLTGSPVRRPAPGPSAVRDRLTVAPRAGAPPIPAPAAARAATWPAGPERALARALERAEAFFTAYFTRLDHRVLLTAIENTPGLPDPAALRDLVRRPHRDLADHRAFPRLLDALVLPPLSYGFEPGPAGNRRPGGTGG